MIVLNRSNRTSLYTRCANNVPSTFDFSYQKNRRLAYQQRLYFEYLYTQKVGGISFFYTLTYNNKSIPVYVYGNKSVPCFSYDDIRKVTVGSLEKQLKRKYGAKLRYFCSCERGEGKGTRGYGNNPHYHFIFFVQPFNDSYCPPTPQEFRDMVKRLWLGTAAPIDYTEAKKGIAKEGDNLGVVVNASALKYVSKYVTKDASDSRLEYDIFDYWQKYALNRKITSDVIETYKKYCDDESVPVELDKDFGYDKYLKWRDMTTDKFEHTYMRWFNRYCDDLNVKINIANISPWFYDWYVPQFALYKLREYRNQYSGKVRCSKSLGEYGLNFVHEESTDPYLNIPYPDGYDVQPLCLFYYRKLYYDTYKCDVTGNVLYRLNKKGVALHQYQFPKLIDKSIVRTTENIGIVMQNKTLDLFQKLYKDSQNFVINSQVLHNYSIYKKVYEFRTFNIYDGLTGPNDTFDLDLASKDYTRFLENDSYLFDWQFSSIFWKRQHSPEYRDYSTHPCVKPFLSVFKFLDELNDVVEQFRSDVSKRKFDDNSDRQKRHNASKFT